jgi:hypothetical protein
LGGAGTTPDVFMARDAKALALFLSGFGGDGCAEINDVFFCGRATSLWYAVIVFVTARHTVSSSSVLGRCAGNRLSFLLIV